MLHLFALDHEHSRLLQGHHDIGLMALSVLVAMLASGFALQVASLVRVADTTLSRRVALLSGSLVLGGGIWAMHFIGMLSFNLPMPVDYDPLLTLLSVLPAMLASWVALSLLAREGRQFVIILIGGILVGAGIGAMHYTGMFAMQLDADLRFDPVWFLISIVVAVLMAMLALWVHYGLRVVLNLGSGVASVLGGICMGLAIASMHYTGMMGARFVAHETAVIGDDNNNLMLALSIGFGILAIGLVVGATNGILRYRDLHHKIQRSEQQYRSLIANIPGVSFRCLPNQDWNMLFISDAVFNLTGYPASEFLTGGRSFSDVIHPDDAGRIFKEVMNSLRQGNSQYTIRYRVLHKDGSERWVTESASASYDKDGKPVWLDGVIVDITEARRRNAEFEGTVDAISRAQAVIEFDLEGRIHSLNPMAEVLCGCHREQLTGRNWTALFNADEFADDLWQQLRQGKFQQGEFALNTPQGERWIQAYFNPILSADGSPLKIVLLASDLTERRTMVQDLQQAKDKAELSVDAKSAFLANMSHEIRTPMNAIIGFSELLLESSTDNQQYRHIKTVNNSARSLLRLLNDILDTAKLDRGAIELEQRDFNLRLLCEDLVEVLSLQASAKGIELTLKYRADHDWYRGDSLRVRQVVLNLLSNAVKFTEQGQVQLEVDADTDSGLHIGIIDTGIGIDPDRLQHIFAPFAQADASMSRRFGGTGLGTTIAQQLTVLMGGHIDVSSEPGVGSRFEIHLPLVPGSPQLQAQHVATRPQRSLRILAADDVEENLELLRHVLKKAGHQIDLATGGDEAVSLFKNQNAEQRYDLILMDVQMPGTDGLNATRQIRAIEKDHDWLATPVIALTASVLDHDRIAAKEAGMDGFASKPIDWPALQADISRLVPGATAPEPALLQTLLPDTSLAIEHSLIDWPQALLRWGDASALQKALDSFLRQIPELDIALQGPPHTLAALAHRLKGTAANLGVTQLQQQAHELEQRGTLSEVEKVRTTLQQLKTELEQQTKNTDAKNSDTLQALVINKNDIRSLIQSLSRGENTDALVNKLTGSLPPDIRQTLNDCLDNFDFEQAKGLLNGILDNAE